MFGEINLLLTHILYILISCIIDKNMQYVKHDRKR